VSKIRWSRSSNAAADLTVHARTTSIHPPISPVHPSFDKPSTCINASIRPATRTRCGPGRSIAAEPNVVVLKFLGAALCDKYFRYFARSWLQSGLAGGRQAAAVSEQSAIRVIGHCCATQRRELPRPPMPLARRCASFNTAPPAQRPRQLHRTTDRIRGYPKGFELACRAIAAGRVRSVHGHWAVARSYCVTRLLVAVE
jgi:hypothetical protein